MEVEMAYRRRYRGRRMNKGKRVMLTLGSLVGLTFGLWIFDKILDVVIPIVNDSTYFGDVVSFVQDMIPVVGIVAGYHMVKPLFNSFN
jgi:hypothetical protein